MSGHAEALARVDAGGEVHHDLARLLDRALAGSVIEHMGEAYSDKYWIASLGFFRPRASRVSEGKTIAYKVTLSEGTPPPPPKD